MWKEDVRELKILATMLCPPDRFSKEDARRWVRGTAGQEIREQACKNLFQELPCAAELVEEWTGSRHEYIRATGYWLFARLCITRSGAAERMEIKALPERAVADLESESLLMCRSALHVLKFFGRISPANAENMMKRIAGFEHSGNPRKKEIFDLLSFEFG
jgi:hypothetical protein